MIRGMFASAVWFLKRPKLYPQFLHLLKRRLFNSTEADTRVESENWCGQFAISVSEAVRRITGAGHSASVQEKFKSVFEAAHKKVAQCPVVMGGAGDLDLLYYVVRNLKAENVIETGVAYGWSSLALLLGLQDQKGSRLVSTDMPYIQGNNDAYVGLVVPAELRPHWDLIRLADRQALPMALAKLRTIDVCHYDSDKTYAGRMWAYPKLWAALRPGGYFISDDIGDNVGFRDFAHQIGIAPMIIRSDWKEGTKYVGILVKP